MRPANNSSTATASTAKTMVVKKSCTYNSYYDNAVGDQEFQCQQQGAANIATISGVSFCPLIPSDSIKAPHR